MTTRFRKYGVGCGLFLLLMLSQIQAAQASKVKGDASYKDGDKIILTATDLTSPDVQLIWDLNGTGVVDWDENTTTVPDPASTKDKPLPDKVVPGGKCCVWAKPGKYVVTLTSVDFTSKKVQRTRFSFTVEGVTPPPPPPTPTPDVLTPIPDTTGMTYAQAKAAVSAKGFVVAPASGDDDSPVTSQTPVAGTKSKVGTVVTLTLGEKPSPAPIPAAGFRTLIVYDENARSSLPPAQGLVLTSQRVRDYFQSHCVKVGDKEEARIWATDTDPKGESKLWQDAFKRPRKSTPWIVISDGKKGYEGPLPATVDDTLALLKKYGGD